MTGGTSYNALVSTVSTFASTVSSQTGIAGASASVSGLANSATYYWEVSATNTAGTGIWSSIWNFTTVIAIPSAPILSAPASGATNQPASLTLTWGSVTNAATYGVQVSLVSTFASTVSSQTALAAESAAISGLGGSTTYYWRANATDAGGTGVWSSVWSFTTQAGAPIAPTLATPSNGAISQPLSLTLTWGSVANAVTYEAQVATVSTFATTISDQASLAAVSAPVGGLANGIAYYWRVNATDGGGTGAWSSVWKFTTIVAAPGVPALASPANGTAGQATSVTLSWSAATGATSYSALVSTTSTFATTVSSQAGMTGVSAAVSGLANSTAYFWEVNAANAGGTSSWSGVWSFTTVVAPPSAPALASPASGSTNQPTSLTLTWGSVTNATTYGVQVSLVSSFASTVSNQTALAAESAAISGLGGSATYYWRADAADAGGTGVWSSVWSFPTQAGAPVAPTLATPTNGAGGQSTSVTLDWNTVSGATTYSLQVATVSTFATTIAGQSGLTVNSFSMSGLSVNLTYYWKANAANSGGTSAWSGVWSFSTGVNLVIPLAIGWNMNSLNIHPTDSTTGGIFGGFKGFVLVKDGQGNLYTPSLGIDNIGTLKTGSGYQIYIDSVNTIRVTGTPVNLAATSIPLQTLSWSIIAYLPQATMPIDSALAGISSQIILAKNNAGELYWPGTGLNSIDTMVVGQGYLVVTSAAATLTYPTGVAKRLAGNGKSLVSLAATRHYPKHRITGNNASFLARSIAFGGGMASDKCEVGAFDAQGNLVGAGTVTGGMTAFAIWGKDPMTKAKDGCEPSEKISFRLWDGLKESPLEISGGSDPTYGVNKIITAALAVPAQQAQSSFNLPRVYPNPFRGSVHIDFDIPALGGSAGRQVDIGVYDLRGCLVQKIVSGRYAPGSYSASWIGGSSAGRDLSSSVYLIRMKTDGIEKQMRLIEIK